MAHSKFSPSGYSRWSACPGSLALIEQNIWMANQSSSYADEGTLAHSVAEGALKGKPLGCDADMFEHLKIYLQHCSDLKEQATLDPIVEFRSGIPGTDVWGTSDFVAIVKDTLHVVDLKYGAGVSVEVEDNAQLKIYALSTLLTLGDKARGVNKVVITIVQPRCYHPDGPVRSQTLDVLDLLDFRVEVLEAVEATKKKNAPRIPGRHCRFCPVASICPELGEKSVATAAKVFEPATYNARELSETLYKLPMLEAFVKQVREFAYMELSAGKFLPGWKLVEKRAHRKWASEIEATRVLHALLGREAYERPALKSPAQIEKLISLAAKKSGLIEQLTTKESTGTTLVPESD